MTQKIHSQSQPGTLLACVMSAADAAGRTDAADAEEILQASMMRLPTGKTIAPHCHLPQVRTTTGTCEAWVVVSGRLIAQVFDLDQSLVATVGLTAGDCMILYRGGHNFTVVSADAVMYEIKNGPYNGPESDSEKIQ
jgi:mannose-6-phosphate isomerase-like protein (cupin superfamily)